MKNKPHGHTTATEFAKTIQVHTPCAIYHICCYEHMHVKNRLHIHTHTQTMSTATRPQLTCSQPHNRVTQQTLCLKSKRTSLTLGRMFEDHCFVSVTLLYI